VQRLLRWQTSLHDGLFAMRERGDLRPQTDLDELSMALLTALQGGSLVSNTLRTSAPMRASMNAASPTSTPTWCDVHAGRSCSAHTFDAEG
jgi:hypothetical protein